MAKPQEKVMKTGDTTPQISINKSRLKALEQQVPNSKPKFSSDTNSRKHRHFFEQHASERTPTIIKTSNFASWYNHSWDPNALLGKNPKFSLLAPVTSLHLNDKIRTFFRSRLCCCRGPRHGRFGTKHWRTTKRRTRAGRSCTSFKKGINTPSLFHMMG